MLKYKRKRIIRSTIAVIVPIIIIASIALILHYTKRVDLSQINIISSTQNLFTNEDSLTHHKDKMAVHNQNSTSTNSASAISNNNKNDSIPNFEISINHFEGQSEPEYTNTDTLNFQKDILIATKKYTIPINQKENAIDSLLMNRPSSHTSLTFTIEFWKSPINFKGYKRSQTKAVIFGVTEIDQSNLYIDNHQYYLIIDNRLFLLESTNDFKKLTEITI